MFDRIGTIESSGQGAHRVQSPVVDIVSSAKDNVDVATQTAPLSPRMTSDPAAGVIVMEYLSDDGSMTMQLPSRTVVAYLRSGLSEAGLPIPDEFISLNEKA